MFFHEQISNFEKADSLSNSHSSRTALQRTPNPNIILQRVRKYPHTLTQADTMILQKTIGNHGVSQLMREIGGQGNSVTGIHNNTNSVQSANGVNRTGLPDNLKAGVENISGLAMDDVRVHYNSDKPEQVGALAYTRGRDIHVAPGQERHLPHEAWHVVQQAQGRVKPTTQFMGIAVNDNEGLEKEATEMGKRAVSGKERPGPIQKMAASGKEMPVQMQAIKGDGNITGTVVYDPRANSAFKMHAHNIRLKAGKHRLANEHSPTAQPDKWQNLVALGLTVDAPQYKRMHLLNGQLGGHGNKVENLAPGSADLNSTHFNKVERILRRHVLAGGTIISYDVHAFYHSVAPSFLTADEKKVFKKTLKSIHCQYVLSGGGGDSLTISEDSRTINRAWRRLHP